MIKFFRSIRQNLLNEGKTTKYLKYAVGEIVLVVIGILIALQINNWNEDRKNRSLERDYLMALKEDVKSDSLNLQVIKEQIESHIHSANLLLNFIDNGIIVDTIAAKNAIFNAGYLLFFNASLSTYNDLVNSGQLGIIKDKELKDLIDNYVSWLTQLDAREEVSIKTVWTNYGDYYKTNYVKDGRMSVDFRYQNIENLNKYAIDWNKMRKDQELRRLLTWVIATAESQKAWSKITMTHVSNIKSRIVNLMGNQT